MSAWIVSKRHIDLLVEALFKYEVPLDNDLSPDEIGQILWAENYRSVNYRYGKDIPTPEYHHDSESVRDLVEDQVLVYKQITCYDYQSCECKDYDNTSAARMMNALSNTLNKLAGYLTLNESLRDSKRWHVLPWGIDYHGISTRRSHHDT